jgi:hypothetical protein
LIVGRLRWANLSNTWLDTKKPRYTGEDP